MTLTTYMRDMVFSPLCRILGRRFGPRATPHVIAVSIMAVFVAMGAWHGLAWNTLIYGSLHGVGVVSCHYYTLWLKKRLGKQAYAAYQNNAWIRGAGIAATFTFVVGTLFFFANSMSDIREIFELLR
jgi:membrane protein involved in D-alanine export